jgi:hypothetical protein
MLSHVSLCAPSHIYKHLKDFHETLYERYAIEYYNNLVLFNLLQFNKNMLKISEVK